MSADRILLSLAVLGLCCLALTETAIAQSPSLGDLARQYREKKSQGQPGSSTEAQSLASAEQIGGEAGYVAKIRYLLGFADFDRLEQEATEARASKARFPGGVWKLFEFYEALHYPSNGSRSTEADWQTHFAKLQRWLALKPDSITPRLALADSYFQYAWAARGGGYADTVADDGWRLFEERTQMGAQVLKQASQLQAKSRSPYFFELLQNLALMQGWDKSQARALFETASAFEPSYYHYYREYAHYLETKWYGEDGEAEAFAEEAYKRVGGKQGAFIYFEIASILNCHCSDEQTHLDEMSWPKIKEGYAALQELYGVSSLKQNRFALMAVLAGDKTTARQIFSDIGDHWEPTVWHSRRYFEFSRAWAAQ